MKAAFFDVDWTIVNDFSGITFLEFAAIKGKFNQNSLEQLLNARKGFERKEVTYELLADVWGQAISEGLSNQKQGDIYALNEEFWELIQPKFAYWANDLIALFNQSGYRTIAISGSNIELLHLYKEKLGFSEVFATKVEVKGGIYTGRLLLNLVLDQAKKRIFQEIVEKEKIDTSACFGFGDSEHDRAFLDQLAYPVAINPSSGLRQVAQEKGWSIFEFNENVLTEIARKISSETVERFV